MDAKTAWVSGDEGGVWRTTDGGKTWQDVRPDAEKPLAFRDVEADSAQVAQVLAIGPRGQSRIYKTVDGGKSWKRTFKNAEADAFYDCLAMFPDGLHGVAMSDPVDGKFRVITTKDAGDTWKIVNPKGMPRAKDGEFGFAASGTCVVTAGIKDAWIASGGTASRVFHSRDYGQTWTVAKTSIPADPDGGGVFSLAFRTRQDRHRRRWQLPLRGRRPPDVGAHRLTAATPGSAAATSTATAPASRGCRTRRAPIAVGPSGTEISDDGGRTWTTIGGTGFHSVQCVGNLEPVCWASGPEGMVARWSGLPVG